MRPGIAFRGKAVASMKEASPTESDERSDPLRERFTVAKRHRSGAASEVAMCPYPSHSAFGKA